MRDLKDSGVGAFWGVGVSLRCRGVVFLLRVVQFVVDVYKFYAPYSLIAIVAAYALAIRLQYSLAAINAKE